MGGGRRGSPRPESLTILLTTHYLEEADQLADRLAIVSQGKVVVEGTPAELKARPARRRRARRARERRGRRARSACSRASARRPRQVLDGRTIVVARRERRPRAAGDPLRARRRRDRGRVGVGARARRSTTSTSTSPAASSATEDRGA